GVIAAQSSATTITPTNPCVTIPVTFTNASSDSKRAWGVTIQLSPELQLCGSPAASIHEGTFLSSSTTAATYFTFQDQGGGKYRVDCTILGSPCGQTARGGTLFTVDVTSTSTTACQGSIQVLTLG